ncbi:MAG TPA: amidohydrolase [Chitinophagaceae bacterium]
MKLILLAPLLLLLISCNDDHHFADKVFIGKTWTGNETNEWAEGIAVIADTIAFVGNENDLRKWIGEKTEVVELDSVNIIVPGFIDTHTHFIEGGLALSSVQLRDAKTPEEFISRIAAYAKTLKPGEWITSGDWDHENWGGELPSRFWIDSVTRDNPVWINRLDGHMCLANSKALAEAKINKQVKDVPGGTITRSKDGEITGIFKDNAMELIGSKVPPPTAEQEENALNAAMNYVAEKGVTSVHNMSGFHALFERFHSAGKLKTRIYAGMAMSNWRALSEKIRNNGRGDNWLRFGGLKEFVDGSLGSHTASFFKPFKDNPKDSGFFLIEEKVLYERIKSADSAGLHLMVHAIGDKAIHSLLNIYERVSRENGPRDRRFRIEHAQHIAPDDISRFHELNVIPSMQPYHAIDDGRWAEKIIGADRIRTTYAFRSLLDAKARLCFGSDWFVAPATPLEGIYASVTRRTLDEKNPDGWVPEQKISVTEALACYTRNAAFASFEENSKGSLAAGKLADFVILEQDITNIPPQNIRNVKVLLTHVGDKVAYRK